jgi:hypothetical protein
MIAGGEWRALCPAHDDHSPSLAITQKPDGMILFKCQSQGCSQQEIIAALEERGLWPFRKRAGSTARISRPDADAPIEPDPRAVALWNHSVPCEGTKAQRYLHARGLTIDPPPSLRFCADHVYRPAMPARGVIVPAMVAAVQALDGRITAVQVTALDRSEDRKFSDKGARKIYGPVGSGAVRLAEAGQDLGLAEGVEDALGAMQLTGIPCWACLGAVRMHRVEIPASVRTLHIFADADDAGERAAQRTADRFSLGHERVVVRLPPDDCKDWGELAARLGTREVAP